MDTRIKYAYSLMGKNTERRCTARISANLTMMKKASLSALAAATLLLASTSAFAADKSPAIFPTDVLDQGHFSFSMDYTWTKSKADTTLVAGGTTYRFNDRSTGNEIDLRADVGLGYGVSLFAGQVQDTGSHSVSKMNGATATDTNTEGNQNPYFGINWSPTATDKSAPTQLKLQYMVSPAGFQDSDQGADYPVNRIQANLSFNNNSDTRQYITYAHVFLGKSDGYKNGGYDSLAIGLESKLSKDTLWTASYEAVLYSGSDIAKNSTSQSVAVSLQQKLASNDKTSLYLVPELQTSYYSSSEATSKFLNSTGVDSVKVDSFWAHSARVMMKLVF